ncbi:ATP-binding protein [Desulfoplanes sp.]
MQFINREQELIRLEREYARSGFSFSVIYGRRRMGKTRLIKEFIHQKNALYFLADTQTETLNMQRLQMVGAEQFGDDLLADIRFDDWEKLVRYIVERAAGNTEKFILVIDEFQYLAQANSAMPSVWQRIVDQFLAHSNVMLILCGSIIPLMYKHTLDYASPLYGRRTSQLKLAPLNFMNFEKFYPNASNHLKVELYSILGGVPKYIELFDVEEDIFSCIQNNFLDTSSFFYQEPRFLLNEEFSSQTTYFSILQIIASGEHKLGKIASKVGTTTNNLTSFMNKLRELDILTREVPILEDNPEKSKKGLYFFKDNFLQFWFSFIFPYTSYLEMDNQDFVLSRIKTGFQNHCALAFEKICIRLLYADPPVSLSKIGRYWDKNVEIDIVGIGDQDILFGECKWSSHKVGTNILSDLQHKLQNIPRHHIQEKRIHYALFSKTGFTDDMIALAHEKGIRLFSFEH